MKDYAVIRFANKPDGTVSISNTTHDNITSAQKDFFRACALAVDSANLTECVVVIHKTGVVVKDPEHFEHPAPEPEEEPEEPTEGEGE